MTARQAAQEFVRTWWAHPRKSRLFNGETFQMVGGTGRVYRVGRYSLSSGTEVFAVTTETP